MLLGELSPFNSWPCVDPKKDIFGRAHHGKGLSNIVATASDPLVIAVDGQWGSGKSVFLKMWAGELRKAGFPVVHFDAFEHDYNSDAFLAIAGQIISLLQEIEEADASTTDEFKDTAIRTMKVLGRNALNLAVRAVSVKVFGTENIAEAFADQAVELTDEYVGKRLTEQKAEKDTIKSFREALAKLPSRLQKSDANKKPLIFIVDELDRCKPLFALELLERIKHFFSVPNVHFVLGVNLVQLRNSVMMAYSPNIDAHLYLEKFIHLTLTFNSYAKYPSEQVAHKYINYLLQVMDFDSNDRVLRQTCECVKRISIARNLSFRSIEKILGNVAVALAFSSEDDLRVAPILAGLCVIKAVAPETYMEIKQGVIEFNKIVDILKIPFDQRDDHAHEIDWWTYCADRDADPSLVQRYDKTLGRYDVRSRFEILPTMANYILDNLTQ